jgi:hypothetical protein
MTEFDLDAYRALIRRANLDPGVIRWTEVDTDDERAAPHRRGGGRVRLSDFGTIRFRCENSNMPVVVLPEALHQSGSWFVPRTDPQLRSAPKTAADYWVRTGALAEQIGGSSGRLQLSGGRENGWLSIAERMVDAIVCVLGEHDVITVALDVNWGVLDATVHADCLDPTVGRYIGDLGQWAEAATSRRCMVSGEPGWRGPVPGEGPWQWILSDAVRALPDPVADHRIYPRPVGAPR